MLGLRGASRPASHNMAVGAILCIAAFVLLACRARTAFLVGEGDARLFAYIGKMWGQGLIPYRDIWDNKPPGIFALMLAANYGPIGTFPNIAVIELVFVLAATIAAFKIINRLSHSELWALLGAAAFACGMSVSSLGGAGLTEVFGASLATWALWFFVRTLSDRACLPGFLGGLFCGFATQFKLPGASVGIAAVASIFLLAVVRAVDLRRLSLITASVLAGFATAWMPWILYFTHYGVATELMRVSFEYPFAYAAGNSRSLMARVAVAADNLIPVAHLLAPVIIAGGILGRLAILSAWDTLRGKTPNGHDDFRTTAIMALPLLVPVVDFAAAVTPGRNYPHYFVPFAASLTLAAACSLAVLARDVRIDLRRALTASALAGCIVVPIAVGAVATAVGDLSHSAALARSASSTQRAAEFIRGQASPGDRLFVWPYRPRVYEQSGLLPASPYLTGVNLRDSPIMYRKIAPALQEMLRSRPARFIVAQAPNSGSTPELPIETAFHNALHSDYDFEKRFGELCVFVRRDPSTERTLRVATGGDRVDRSECQSDAT